MKRIILAGLLIVIVALIVVLAWYAAPPQGVQAGGYHKTPTPSPRDCYCFDPVTREIDWCACPVWRGRWHLNILPPNRWRR